MMFEKPLCFKVIAKLSPAGPAPSVRRKRANREKINSVDLPIIAIRNASFVDIAEVRLTLCKRHRVKVKERWRHRRLLCQRLTKVYFSLSKKVPKKKNYTKERVSLAALVRRRCSSSSPLCLCFGDVSCSSILAVDVSCDDGDVSCVSCRSSRSRAREWDSSTRKQDLSPLFHWTSRQRRIRSSRKEPAAELRRCRLEVCLSVSIDFDRETCETTRSHEDRQSFVESIVEQSEEDEENDVVHEIDEEKI